MPLFIEGIGGSGKGVVNLLKFCEGIARLAQRQVPALECVVIDQDPNGVWPDLTFERAVANAFGEFADAMGIGDVRQRAAAGLLYSDAELRTNVGQGFHGHPKLPASLLTTFDSRLGEQSGDHVLIYSDIGGTGAGLGPVRLENLLANPRKRHVIAIVFGRYLNRGTQNPTGFEWLRNRKLPPGQQERWLTAYYINVPVFQVSAQAPPASGLNPAQALTIANAYVWRLADAASRGTLDEVLETNDRQNQRERIQQAGYSSPGFQIAAVPTDLIADITDSAQRDRIDRLVPAAQQEVNRSLRDFLASSELTRQSWQVFRSAPTTGAAPGTAVNWSSSFGETFSSVPSAWAAAEWFHRAVAAGEPTCREALRRLVALYVQGKLHVMRAHWSPRGGPELYVLATRQIKDDDPDYENVFAGSVVGGFSRDFPFWTVPAFLGNLRAAQIDDQQPDVQIRLSRRTPCSGIYHTAAGAQAVAVPTMYDFRYKLELSGIDSVAPNTWHWAITAEANSWHDFSREVGARPFLSKHLDIQDGELVASSPRAAYRCAIRGVQVNSRVLPQDGIAVGAAIGPQFRQISVTAGAAAPIVSSVLNKVLDGQPTEVDAGSLVVLVGNFMLTVNMLTT